MAIAPCVALMDEQGLPGQDTARDGDLRKLVSKMKMGLNPPSNCDPAFGFPASLGCQLLTEKVEKGGRYGAESVGVERERAPDARS